ncbi:MAG: CRTAC1 family protein, partial [Longimicrobiales bacterium]
FVANGFISGESRESYWYDYSLITGGNRSIIADARNWPAIRGRSLSGYQHDNLWLNDGAGRFHDVTRAVGAAGEAHDGRAVAFADLWNRGALDIIVANQRGPLLVYENTVTPGHGWIAYELEGTRSNRSAIGAEVHLYRDDVEHTQQVDGGNGFASQNQRRVHFGLGAAQQVDSVLIRWPSGARQRIESPEINTLHRIVEPTEAASTQVDPGATKTEPQNSEPRAPQATEVDVGAVGAGVGSPPGTRNPKPETGNRELGTAQ